ncbi:MAG: hypothetical protein UMV23_05760 [Halanaerobium sp.]|nr:hypothetical protein [Halanaerobium sp.]
MIGSRGFLRGMMLGLFTGITAALLIDWDKVREKGQEVLQQFQNEQFREDLQDKLSGIKESSAQSVEKVIDGLEEEMEEGKLQRF